MNKKMHERGLLCIKLLKFGIEIKNQDCLKTFVSKFKAKL